MLFSIAIVEDNDMEAQILKEYLERYASETGNTIEIVRFSSGFKFLDGYKAKYDVVFMDIEMPDMNGMKTARKLRTYDKNIVIIFVTNMAKYAINGYEVNALDYFLKPVHYSDIKMRMERIRQMLENRGAMFTIPFQGGVKRLSSNEILYVESISHTMIFHTDSGEYTNRGMSMKQIEENLIKCGFFRCNTCYIVNLKYCRGIDGNTVIVGDKELQISRARKKDFMEALIKNFQI